MQKFRSIILLFIILQSCQKEIRTTYLDSIVTLQTSTEKWLISKKDSIDFIQSTTIDSVLLKLNWDLIQIKQISGNKEMAYIPFYSEANKGVTIVYNNKNFTVDTANIISAQLTNSLKININNVNIYNKTFNSNFSAVISIFSIDNKLQSTLGIVKGKKLFSGEIRKKINGQKENIKSTSVSIKSNSSFCKEYYLVTTYEDGFEIWTYLYTTCSNDCEITSTIQLTSMPKIRSNCVGNGSGGGYDPSNAQYDIELQLFENDYRGQMSDEEKKIFDTEMDKAQRIKYLINAKMAISLTNNFFNNGEINNGKGDAFRHALFIALNAKSLDPILAGRLANAHENVINNHPLSKEMDLRNNQIGLNLFYALNAIPNDYVSYFTLLQVELISKINNGDLWIINNLDRDYQPTQFSVLVKSNL